MGRDILGDGFGEGPGLENQLVGLGAVDLLDRYSFFSRRRLVPYFDQLSAPCLGLCCFPVSRARVPGRERRVHRVFSCRLAVLLVAGGKSDLGLSVPVHFGATVAAGGVLPAA